MDKKKTLILTSSALVLAGASGYGYMKYADKKEVKKESPKQEQTENKKEVAQERTPVTPPSNNELRKQEENKKPKNESTTSTVKPVDNKVAKQEKKTEVKQVTPNKKQETVYNVAYNKDNEVIDKTVENVTTTSTEIDAPVVSKLKKEETPIVKKDTKKENKVVDKKDLGENNSGTYSIKDINYGANNTGTHNVADTPKPTVREEKVKEIKENIVYKETKFVNEKGEEIAPTVKDQLVDNKDINNYVYVRTIANETSNVHVYKKVERTILFVDKDTNKELKRYTDTLFVKAPEEFEGLKLVEKLTKENTIVFYYQKEKAVNPTVEDKKVEDKKIEDKKVEAPVEKPQPNIVVKDNKDILQDTPVKEEIKTLYVNEDGEVLKEVKGVADKKELDGYVYSNTTNTNSLTTHYYRYKRVQKEKELPVVEKIVENKDKYDFESKVLSVGKPGKLIETYVVKNGKEVLEKTDRQDGEDRVIEKGTIKTKEETVKEIIETDFEIEEVKNDNKYEDYYKVTPGEKGKIEKTYKELKTEDGKVISKELEKTEEIKKPVKEIREKGTKSTVSYKEENEEINYITETIDDSNLFKGEEVKEAGEKGLKTKKYKVITDGNTGSEKEKILVEEKTVKQPKKEVIRRGTKELFETKENTEENVVPYSVKEEKDNNLWEDETVVKDGANGKEVYKVKTVVNLKTNEKSIERKLVEKVEAKDKVIKKGTKPVYTKTTDTVEEVLPFDTVVEYVDNFKDYTEEVDGKAGKRTSHYEIIVNNKTNETVRRLVNVEEEKPVNKVIKRGTKDLTTVREVKENVEIPYTTEIKNIDTEFADYYKETPGKAGTKEITYEEVTDHKNNNKITKIFKSEKELLSPVNNVIERGTKPLYRTEEKIEKLEIPYNTIVKKDNTLLVGKTREDETSPKNGEITRKYKITIDNKTNKEVDKVLLNESTTIEKRDRIIYEGTKPLTEVVGSGTDVKNIEYKTVYKDDFNLWEGETSIEKGHEGRQGTITEYFNQVRNNENNTVSKVVVKVDRVEAVDRVVKVGKKPLYRITETTRKKEIPFNVEYIENDQAYKDETGIYKDKTTGYAFEGEAGEIVETYREKVNLRDNNKTEEIISIDRKKEPVVRKIWKGTKEIETTDVRTVQENPVASSTLDTVMVEDPTKYPFEITSANNVVSEGTDGYTEIVYNDVYVKGVKVSSRTVEVSRKVIPPKPRVIKVGTRKETVEDRLVYEKADVNSPTRINIVDTENNSNKTNNEAPSSNEYERVYKMEVNTANGSVVDLKIPSVWKLVGTEKQKEINLAPLSFNSSGLYMTGEINPDLKEDRIKVVETKELLKGEEILLPMINEEKYTDVIPSSGRPTQYFTLPNLKNEKDRIGLETMFFETFKEIVKPKNNNNNYFGSMYYKNYIKTREENGTVRKEDKITEKLVGNHLREETTKEEVDLGVPFHVKYKIKYTRDHTKETGFYLSKEDFENNKTTSLSDFYDLTDPKTKKLLDNKGFTDTIVGKNKVDKITTKYYYRNEQGKITSVDSVEYKITTEKKDLNTTTKETMEYIKFLEKEYSKDENRVIYFNLKQGPTNYKETELHFELVPISSEQSVINDYSYSKTKNSLVDTTKIYQSQNIDKAGVKYNLYQATPLNPASKKTVIYDGYHIIQQEFNGFENIPNFSPFIKNENKTSNIIKKIEKTDKTTYLKNKDFYTFNQRIPRKINYVKNPNLLIDNDKEIALKIKEDTFDKNIKNNNYEMDGFFIIKKNATGTYQKNEIDSKNENKEIYNFVPSKLTDADKEILKDTTITIEYNTREVISRTPSYAALTKGDIQNLLSRDITPEKSDKYFDDEYVLKKHNNNYKVVVGTKKAITELSEEELEEKEDEVVIPYKTITKTDDKLEVGEIRKTPGKNGAYNKRKYKYVIDNRHPEENNGNKKIRKYKKYVEDINKHKDDSSYNKETNRWIEKPPVDEVVLVGTKPKTRVELTEETVKIPITTIYKEDSSKPKGYEYIENKGIEGEQRVYKQQKITTDAQNVITKENPITYKEETITKMVPKVIIRGTGEGNIRQTQEKARGEVRTEYRNESKYTENGVEKTLYKGDEYVLEVGSKEKYKEKYKEVWDDKTKTIKEVKIDDEITSQASPRVILRGTVDRYVSETTNVRTENLEKKTVVSRLDENQYTDYEKEEEAGTAPTKKTYTKVIRDLKENRVIKETEEVEITEGTPRKVIRGAKPIEEITTSEENKVIPYTTRTIEDNTKLVGENGITKNGEAGIEKHTYTITTNRGKQVSKVLSKKETLKQPIEEVRWIGTKPITEVGKPFERTKEIPNRTVIVSDNDKWEGEPDVIIEGKAGKIIQKVAKVKDNRNNTEKEVVIEEKTEAPKDTIIKRASKKVYTEKANEVEEKVKEKYKTRIEERTDKPTTYRNVKVSGRNKKVRITYKVVHNNKTNKDEKTYLNEIVLEDLRDEVIEVGTIAPVKVEKLPVEKQVIKYTTRYENTDTLVEGQTQTKTKGVNGEIRVSKQKVITTDNDGKQSVRIEELSKERTEPTTEVILVGTKKRYEISEEKTKVENLPPKADVIEYDSNKYSDTPDEIINGKQGRIILKYKERKDNLTGLIEEINKEYTREESVAKRIIKGTKAPSEERVLKSYETVLKNTIVKYDNNKFEDYENTEEGIDGVIEVSSKVRVDSRTGKQIKVGEDTRRTTREVKNTVITRGTKPLLRYETEYGERKDIPYETVYRNSDELDVGETREIKGQVGKVQEITYVTIDNKTGKVIKRANKGTKEISPKVDRVVINGTRAVEVEREDTKRITATVEEIRRANPNLLKGTEKELSPSELRVVEQKFKIIYNKKTGKEISRTVESERVIEAGRGREIEYGTAEEIKYKERETIVKEPGVKYVDEPEWDDDRTELIQNGNRGKVTNVYEVTKHWQKGIVKRELVETIPSSEYKDKIIKRGTKLTGTITNEKISSVFLYEIEKIPDNTLLIGETKVVKPGVKGKYIATYRIIRDRNGKLISRTQVDYQITQPAEKEIVRIGTKKEEGLMSDKTALPFETIVRINKNLKPDEIKEIQKGVNGEEINYYILDKSNPGIVYKVSKNKEISIKPTPRIIEAGINVKHPIYRLPIWSNLSGATKKYVDQIPTNFEDIATMPSSVKREKATFKNSGWHQYNKETLDFLHTSLNLEKLRQHFLSLVNKERNSKGIASISYNYDLEEFAQVRSDELSTVGSIRVNDKPHVRLDETPWNTVLDNSKFDAVPTGENLAMFALTNPFSYLSEEYIAEELFKQWKNSPGHYQNFMDVRNSSMALAIQYSPDFWNRTTNSFLGINGIIGTQLLEKTRV
jgi:IgA-specific serine endopeptidase